MEEQEELVFRLLRVFSRKPGPFHILPVKNRTDVKRLFDMNKISACANHDDKFDVRRTQMWTDRINEAFSEMSVSLVGGQSMLSLYAIHDRSSKLAQIYDLTSKRYDSATYGDAEYDIIVSSNVFEWAADSKNVIDKVTQRAGEGTIWLIQEVDNEVGINGELCHIMNAFYEYVYDMPNAAKNISFDAILESANGWVDAGRCMVDKNRYMMLRYEA